MAGLASWHRIHFSPPKACPWLSEKVTAANNGMDQNRVAMATGIIMRVFIVELDSRNLRFTRRPFLEAARVSESWLLVAFVGTKTVSKHEDSLRAENALLSPSRPRPDSIDQVNFIRPPKRAHENKHVSNRGTCLISSLLRADHNTKGVCCRGKFD